MSPSEGAERGGGGGGDDDDDDDTQKIYKSRELVATCNLTPAVTTHPYGHQRFLLQVSFLEKKGDFFRGGTSLRNKKGPGECMRGSWGTQKLTVVT